MNDSSPKSVFPPTLAVGNRVWSEYGYPQHGPADGPKVDIAANMGGTVVSTEHPYNMDFLLYAIHWDNGQVSKHYSKDLFCIGHFRSRSDFEKAIKPIGPVAVVLGPKGGFREARLALEYDGVQMESTIANRDVWLKCVEKLVKDSGVIIAEERLPSAARKPRQRQSEF